VFTHLVQYLTAHPITVSILENEDIAQEIHLHLQSCGKYAAAIEIIRFLDRPEIREQFGLNKGITERTARRWMAKMGYRWKREPKGQYKDGHEREDVVSYRQNVLLPFFSTISPFTRHWTSDGELLNPEPPLLGLRVIVWVHDESTFYANDRRTLRWVHKSESAKPYAKGEGVSLMVADFVSADYGWLRSPDGWVISTVPLCTCLMFVYRARNARVLFKAGKNHDGYFSNTDVVAQLNKAMDLLNEFYGNEIHVFLYDNAKTHTARRPNALSARHMTVNPSKDHSRNFLCTVKNADGSQHQVQMQNGAFSDSSPQSFYFPLHHPEARIFKGMRLIIRERIAQGATLPDPTKLNAECRGFKCPPGRTNCCCRRILFTQPDFVAQQSMLEEVAESRGFRVIFNAKFHCELSFIEQCWGYSKRVYREYPASSTEADLERNVLNALNSVPLVSMRR
jgi:hypothetical protein